MVFCCFLLLSSLILNLPILPAGILLLFRPRERHVRQGNSSPELETQTAFSPLPHWNPQTTEQFDEVNFSCKIRILKYALSDAYYEA